MASAADDFLSAGPVLLGDSLCPLAESGLQRVGHVGSTRMASGPSQLSARLTKIGWTFALCPMLLPVHVLSPGEYLAPREFMSFPVKDRPACPSWSLERSELW